jgi:hypothetical protein
METKADDRGATLRSAQRGRVAPQSRTQAQFRWDHLFNGVS